MKSNLKNDNFDYQIFFKFPMATEHHKQNQMTNAKLQEKICNVHHR